MARSISELPTPSAAKAQSTQATRLPWPVFMTAASAVFLVSLDATVLFAAFGALLASFPAYEAAETSWVLNAYTLVYAALLVPAGKLADSYGSKRIFMYGLACFGLASLACGWAVSMPWLICARVLQGVGAALLTPASLALVLAAFPAQKRAVVVSLWGAVGGLAAALGPSLGTLLIEYAGWRWIFWINVVPVLWALYQARRSLPAHTSNTSTARLDVLGLALLIGAVGWMTWSVIRTESLGWSHMAVWQGLAGGLALLLVFGWWARVVAHPAIDVRLFASRNYRVINIATLLFGMAFAMMFFGFYFFLTGVWHYSLPLAGLAITPGPLMVVPAAVVSGKWAARHGHRGLLVLGCLLLAAGGGMQYSLLTSVPAFWAHWLPCQIVTGIAVGMAMPALAAAAVSSLKANQYGQGSAINQAVRQFGSVLGVALTVALLGHAGISLHDFQQLSLRYAGLALLAALVCLRFQPGAKA